MNTTRRQFLLRSALAGAAPLLLPSRIWSAQGPARPNNRITLGFIGVGTQGRHLLNSFLPQDAVQVLAVNDVDTTRRLAHQKKVEEFYTTKQDKDFKGCAEYRDFRELLARPDIDAVVIATPDHWHAYPVVAAASAKKDIYCEKPLSLTIHEARAMANAVRANQVVFQTGSMQRSSGEFWRACSLVRNGAIGKVKEVYVSVGGPSRWCDLKEEPMEPGLDWDFWLGPAPLRPYNSVLSPRGVHQHFPDWRSYREYSGGGMTDWGAHHFDIAQWGLGMDHSGPVEILPPDGKDQKHLTFKYANGVVVRHTGHDVGQGVTFFGSEGRVNLMAVSGRAVFEPEALGRQCRDAETQSNDPLANKGHYANFLDCVRTRKTPAADVEIGCRTLTVCLLGNIAHALKRPLRWDPVKEEFPHDAEANRWLARAHREPW